MGPVFSRVLGSPIPNLESHTQVQNHACHKRFRCLRNRPHMRDCRGTMHRARGSIARAVTWSRPIKTKDNRGHRAQSIVPLRRGIIGRWFGLNHEFIIGLLPDFPIWFVKIKDATLMLRHLLSCWIYNYLHQNMEFVYIINHIKYLGSIRRISILSSQHNKSLFCRLVDGLQTLLPVRIAFKSKRASILCKKGLYKPYALD